MSSPDTGRSLRRKPVPTPRNTLKKPPVASRSRQPDLDSQGHGSMDSPSSEEAAASCSKTDSGAGGEDILAALEKITGVGSLRSVQSSLGSSLPSLTLDKVKREESSHSLAEHHNSPPDQSASASGFMVKQQRSLRFHTERRPRPQPQLKPQPKPQRLFSNLSQRSSTVDSASSPKSLEPPQGDQSPTANSQNENNPAQNKSMEDRHQSSSEEVEEEEKSLQKRSSSEESPTSSGGRIQTRPLPELPKLTSDKEDEISVIQSDVYSSLLSPDHYAELTPAKVIIKKMSNSSNCLTLSGTIRRGPRVPQQEVDVQLTVTSDHLRRLEKRVHDKYHDRCFCGLRRGPHVLALSLLFLPLALLLSALSAFHLGTLTWYSVFEHASDDGNCCRRLVLPPMVLLAYPLWIVPVTLGLALYGSVAQLSWYLDSWLQAVRAPDGGFFDWCCRRAGLPDCSPYQVVLLSSSDSGKVSV